MATVVTVNKKRPAAEPKPAGESSGGWLFKEEPSHYSFADLEKDGETVWEGVANPVARKHLRETKVGDRVLYYHTGKQRPIVLDAPPDFVEWVLSPLKGSPAPLESRTG